MLRRLRLVDGGVDTDAETAAELVDLIVEEARGQRSTANVTANAVVRQLTASLLDRVDPVTVAAMTDDELWCALAGDPVVGETATRFRRSPGDWVLVPRAGDWAASSPPATDVAHEIRRSYLDLPSVDGVRGRKTAEIEALERSLPLLVHVRRVPAAEHEDVRRQTRADGQHQQAVGGGNYQPG